MAEEKIMQNESIQLPEVVISGEESFSHLLRLRRSIREYQNAPISLFEIGQLLWAAQGITHPEGLRTAPSAGALYPLELFLVAGQVEELTPGIYHYDPEEQQLTLVSRGDHRNELANAALGQTWIADAAASIIFTAIYKRTTQKYGDRGERYVHIEVGHAAQNLFLQAEALGLGTVVVGAFDDVKISRVLELPSEAKPLILMPVGRAKGN